MKKLGWMVVGLFLLSALIMGGTYACQQAAEPVALKAAETLSGGEFEKRDDEGVVMNLPQGRIETKQGQYAQVPAGFPIAEPPGNAELVSVTEFSGDEGVFVSVTWKSGWSTEDLVAHYREQLGGEVEEQAFSIPILLHSVTLVDTETNTSVSITRTFGEVTVSGTLRDPSALAE